ncbi:hypothetical protein ACFL2V_18585 [Pseudomonadota bacterium]
MAKTKASLNMEDIKLLKAFFATREEFEELREKVEEMSVNMPTKDELYTMLDKMMVELKANREESVILTGKSSDHEDRITILEDVVQVIKKKVVVV